MYCIFQFSDLQVPVSAEFATRYKKREEVHKGICYIAENLLYKDEMTYMKDKDLY